MGTTSGNDGGTKKAQRPTYDSRLGGGRNGSIVDGTNADGVEEGWEYVTCSVTAAVQHVLQQSTFHAHKSDLIRQVRHVIRTDGDIERSPPRTRAASLCESFFNNDDVVRAAFETEASHVRRVRCVQRGG